MSFHAIGEILPVAPPPRTAFVTEVFIMDFGRFQAPVTLGREVTHHIDDDGILIPIGRFAPTLSDSMKCLVTFSDGTVARSTIVNAREAIRICGQELPEGL